MSNVHLLIISNGFLYLVSVHYRTAKKLIENVEKAVPLIKKKIYLDSGIILVDNDKKTIISCQNAFPVNSLKTPMTVFEV